MENTTSSTAPARIAIQGYPGAFHEIAARNYHQPKEVDIVPIDTFEELVKSVEVGRDSDRGMMAIENSIAGSLMYNYHLLDKSKLNITGEIYLRIRHQLMAAPGQSIQDIKEVHSHPMAIAQCRQFFRQYPHIKLIESTDTALSARKIKEQEQTGIGAIASNLAASKYDLEILAPGIETNKKNYTRFLVLDNGNPSLHPDAGKVSICLTTPHQPGSLHQVLGVLLEHGANMTKIQSMPIIGQEWHYRFFIDFTLTQAELFSKTIENLRKVTEDLKILGTYKKGAYHES